MGEDRERDLPPPGSAWREAESYGCDMSLIEANLRKTPAERIRAHSRALATAFALREGMARRGPKLSLQLRAIRERKGGAGQR